MDDSKAGGDDKKTAREARLAEKLRENLHRRKAQARAMKTDEPGALPKPGAKS